MLTEDQIRLAEAYNTTRRYVKRDEWLRGLDASITRHGLNAEDRSEFASRAGYAAVYAATTLGQQHPEVTHPSFIRVEHGLLDDKALEHFNRLPSNATLADGVTAANE